MSSTAIELWLFSTLKRFLLTGGGISEKNYHLPQLVWPTKTGWTFIATALIWRPLRRTSFFSGRVGVWSRVSFWFILRTSFLLSQGRPRPSSTPRSGPFQKRLMLGHAAATAFLQPSTWVTFKAKKSSEEDEVEGEQHAKEETALEVVKQNIHRKG